MGSRTNQKRARSFNNTSMILHGLVKCNGDLEDVGLVRYTADLKLFKLLFLC